jgi:hypothetical protein
MTYNPNDDLDNENHEESEEPKVPEYENIVTVEPEREIDPNAITTPRTVSEAEEEGTTVSDFKALKNQLRPKFKYDRINDLVRSAMDSRIYPDHILDKEKLIVLQLILEHAEEDSEIPIMDYIMNTEDAIMIGINGQGIGDLLESFGAARDSDIEKVAKGLLD